tara:strand:+ start:507 stop:779 length:273 start_codon:yes stop_codon:yes gene_type:complete
MLEGVIVNRYPIRRTMTFGVLKNWVWCEDCLEWKDACEEVSFVSIEEDVFGKDVMIFNCDKCQKENRNNVISSPTKPRGNVISSPTKPRG